MILLIAAAKLASDAAREPKPNAEEAALASVVPVVPALAWGGALGLLAGLTGTGGGIFLSPLLLFLGWAETRKT